VPEGNVRGAYIPLKTVCSPTDNVILIGDAGGFPNKLTGEGLYDAFKTAYNASRAIIEKKSFKDTNSEVFRKMQNQQKIYEFFFSRFGFWLVRRLLHHPGAIKWLFDTKMKREKFTNK
jgi:flavin-dependent dehydrogenase